MKSAFSPKLAQIGKREILSVLCSLLEAQRAPHTPGRLNFLGSTSNEQYHKAAWLLEQATSCQRAQLAEHTTLFWGVKPAQQTLLAAQLAANTSLEYWLETLVQFWQMVPEEHRAVCFHTSGSTGAATPHRHAFSFLQQEACTVASLLAASQVPARVLSVMPTHHIFGFVFSLLVPQALNVPCAFMPPLPTASLFESLQAGDVVIGFPVFWNSFLACLPECYNTAASTLPANMQLVSATAPCTKETILALCQKLQTNFIEIYGATETSAIAWRMNGAEFYELLPYWQAEHKAGDSLYLSMPNTATPQQYAIPDSLDWHSDRHFVPLGRHDKAVQVGGINVYPQRIEGILRTHPDIQDCAVRLMQAHEGVRLKAFIVPVSQEESCIQRFRKPAFKSWLASKLPTASRPRHFTFGATLPAGGSGKRCDWPITILK